MSKNKDIPKKDNRSKHKIRFVIGLSIGVLAVIVGVTFISQQPYISATRKIEKQLEQMYGVEFEVRLEGLGKTGVYASEGGAKVFYTTDLAGNIKTESYVNSYYADEVVSQIENEVCSCFDECIVIYDCLTTQEFSSQIISNGDVVGAYNSPGYYTCEFAAGSILSYNDYVDAVASAPVPTAPIVRIYIRDNENQTHVEEAKAILKANDETFLVFFYALPNDLFDRAVADNVYCYVYDDYVRTMFFTDYFFPSDYKQLVCEDITYRFTGITASDILNATDD